MATEQTEATEYGVRRELDEYRKALEGFLTCEVGAGAYLRVVEDRLDKAIDRLAQQAIADFIERQAAYLDSLTGDVDETLEYRDGWKDCRDDVRRFAAIDKAEESTDA